MGRKRNKTKNQKFPMPPPAPLEPAEDIVEPPDAEEQELESQLFGALDTEDVLSHFGDEQPTEGSGPGDLHAATKGSGGDEGGVKRTRAWVDEDDGGVSVDLSKVNRLRKLRTHAKEARGALSLRGIAPCRVRRLHCPCCLPSANDQCVCDRSGWQRLHGASASPAPAHEQAH
eukprot:SAG11_NODE_5300_length_1602_cov_2.236194_1_plen_173_part_00